ncbi:acetolactate synthase large subunit [Rossellomorea aquimaris]|jgi:acetolactate synthase I/II/III large subunit|uniref:acetolactate synthase large subunit n=1 Tax=Rossellomorea aquimaris TaxID=189382 RepID=UPI0011E94770|nr:acetolactate synthase large subunit [Rossellomorea aquimaris]TYS90294.1 acetolactate synthase large subunit [Rossellomorea aquimaris]
MRAKVEAEPASQTLTENVNGADMLMKALKEEKVEILFGYPGGAVLPIYDALYKAPIKHVLARHEQGAIHAAEGYARVSGRPGVVIATSGPGATNLVTGIADAMMDSLPLVIFTGQVASGVIGTDAFQEADVVGITMPITKHNYQVRDIKDLPRIVKEAFHIASTGRPGPVLVDIPKDLTLQQAYPVHDVEMDLPGYQPNFYPNPLQIKKLVEAIKVSRQPVILAGAGVLHGKATEELKVFAEQYDIPVIHTLLGLGGFPADHPLFLGMAGMHGCYASNMALHECDLLINIGARFDDRLTGNLATFAPRAKVVHIDIDPAEIGKNVKTQIPIVADAKQALEKLLQHEEEKPDFDAWHHHLKSYKREYPFWYNQAHDVLSPQRLIEQVYEMTNGEAVVTTDVGQHQMWAAQYYSFKKPNNWVTSGGLGTMGFGFPAAIGAQLANSDSTVVAFVGDGGFQMTLQELVLLKELNLPVKVVLLNNGTLGMVRQWQETFFEERYSQSVFSTQPDFVKLAESYGIKGYRVKTQEEVDSVLKEALTSDEPVLIDCWVNPKENVYPMVAPGKGLHEMLGVKP